MLTADRPLYNPAEGYASYIVPGVLVLILQQTLLIGIGMLAGTTRERDRAPSPEGPLTLVLGRVLAYFVLYSVHAVFYFVIVFRLFGLPFRGDLAVTFAFTVPFLLAAICLALAISSFFRERETALQVLLFTSLPALFLAGFSWPLEMVPRWLRTAAALLPSTAAIDGFLRINQMGAALGEVTAEWRLLWCPRGRLLPARVVGPGAPCRPQTRGHAGRLTGLTARWPPHPSTPAIARAASRPVSTQLPRKVPSSEPLPWMPPPPKPAVSPTA